jgi:hypothetical protein
VSYEVNCFKLFEDTDELCPLVYPSVIIKKKIFLKSFEQKNKIIKKIKSYEIQVCKNKFE